MDQQTIEFHKKQMIAENVTLLEGMNKSPNDIDISWKQSTMDDGALKLEMTITDESGDVLLQKSQKISQLNG